MATAITLNLKKTYHDSSDSDYQDDELTRLSEEEKDEQEKDLESLVFGSESCLVSNIDRNNRKKAKKAKKFKSIQVLVEDQDEGAQADKATDQQKPEAVKIGRPKQIADAMQERKPVWQDAADDEM